ncbi:hypothetical protein BGW42_001838 [Actinomortierella wolfii]|nr:hypothetical protein BGW42_001838 [Actinomortierella wolfii]
MLSSGAAAPSLNYSDLDNILNQPETEHNWAAKENACKQIGNAAYPGIQHDHDFVVFMKNHRASFSSAIKTERTRLSGTACDMVDKLAKAMQSDFGPLLGEVFTGPLLQVCARTNKVMVTRAVKALQSTVDAGSLVCLPKACAEIASPNKTLRIACIGLVARSIDRFSAQELEPFVTIFEPVLKEGVSDAAPEVRDTSRKSFKAYASKFPERATALMATMPANVLKYLQPDAKTASGTGSAAGASALSRSATTGGITKSLPTGGVKPSLATRHHSTRDMSLGGTSRVGGSSARPLPVRAASVPVAASADHAGQSSLRSLKTSSLAHHHHQSHHPHQLHQQQLHHSSHHGQHHPHAPSDIPRTSLVERQSSVERPFRSYGSATARHPIPEHSEHSTLSSTTTLSSSGFSARSLNNRSRTLSGNAMTASAMMQRAPAINLAAHGGAQRVAPSGSTSHYSHTSSSGSSSHGSLNTASYNAGRTATKVEPVARSNRMSVSSASGHGPAPKERAMSASERAKAYAASLKLEMSQRRAANDAKAAALRGRRAMTESAEDHPTSPSSLAQRNGQRSASLMSDATCTTTREPWQGARSASPQLESYPASSFDTILSDRDVDSMVDHSNESQQNHVQQLESEPTHQHKENATEPQDEPLETKQPLQDVSTVREHGVLSILTDTNTAKQHGTLDDRSAPLSGSSSVPSSVTSGSSTGSSCSSPASLTWSVASGILNPVKPVAQEGTDAETEEARAMFAKPWPDVDMIPEHSTLFGSTETILRTEAEIAAFHRMQKELAAGTAVEPEPEDFDDEVDLDGAMGSTEMKDVSAEASSVTATSTATTAAAATVATTDTLISTQESEHSEAHMMSDVEQELDEPLEGDVEALLAMDESMDKDHSMIHEPPQKPLHECPLEEMGQTALIQASVD